MNGWKYEDFKRALDLPGVKYLDEAPVEMVKRYAKEYADLQVEEARYALTEIYALEGPGLDGSSENASGRIARLALENLKKIAAGEIKAVEKRVCECGLFSPDVCKIHGER